MGDNINKCEHKFIHDGVRYRISGLRPGSGANNVEYFDSYVCEKCLDMKIKSLGVQSNTYQPLRFDARPMPIDFKL